MAHDAALAALDEALDRTTTYIRDVKANPATYSQVSEDEISRLWRVASIAINSFDSDLGDICYVKSQGWLDPKVWNSPQFKSMKLGLNDLRQARIKFNSQSSGERANRNRASSGEASLSHSVPTWYAYAGVGFLIFTLLILVVLIFGPDHSDKTPLINILVSLGIAGSATFLGGSAAAKGKIPLPWANSSPVEFSAGGGIAVLVITLILMFWVNPAPHTGPQPSEAQDKAVPAITPPKNANDERQLAIWTSAGRTWRDSYTAFQYVRSLMNGAGDSKCFGMFVRNASDPKTWSEVFPDIKDVAGNHIARKWTDVGEEAPPGRIGLQDGKALIQIEPGTMRIYYIDPGMDQNIQSLDRITTVTRAWDERPAVTPGQPPQPECPLGQ